MLTDVIHEARCVRRALHRERVTLVQVGDLAVDDRAHHHGVEQGAEERAEHQHREQGAAVPQVIHRFLDEDGEILAQGCVHGAASMPQSFTKASSRSLSPAWRRNSSGVPRATMRPWAMITMLSQSAATSCITWLE